MQMDCCASLAMTNKAAANSISERETRKCPTPPPLPEDRIPVIVGVGEITDRPKEIADGLEPLALLEEALKRAEADSGGKLLGEIGSLDIVNFLSWRYRDPEQQLAKRLGITPKHAYYGPVGGESPIRYLHEAAKRDRARRMQRRGGVRRRGAVDGNQGRARQDRFAVDAVRA